MAREKGGAGALAGSSFTSSDRILRSRVTAMKKKLRRSQQIRIRTVGFLLVVLMAVLSEWHKTPKAMASGNEGVLTQHNNAQRTGAYLAETELTPTKVNPASFGWLYSLSVDGSIGAQPLYVAGVPINKGSPRDVLYVATRKNKIYAFDVGNAQLTPTQRLLWSLELKDSRGFGAEELPGMDGRYAGDGRILCHQTHDAVGIASTPVIDPDSNTMYVVYRTAPPFGPAQYGTPPVYDAKHYLRKIDIRTGKTLGEQEVLRATPSFDPNKLLNRTGLLLVDGVIYMGFGGAVCDTGGGNPNTPPPHGWVVAFDATTLQMLGSRNTTPKSAMGGVWQSGYGLASDAHGFVYALTGNNQAPNESTLDISTELSNAILQLHLDRRASAASALRVQQPHFTAHNWYRLDTGERFPGDPLAVLACQPLVLCGKGATSKHADGDSDLGSGGAVVLPNGRVLGGGKQGRFYLIEPTSMSQPKQSFQAFYNSWHSGISPCDYDEDQSFGPNIHGTPVVWHPDGVPYSLVYAMPEKDYLKAFRAFDDGHMDERPFLSAMDSGVRSPRGMPGGFLSLSANGGRSGILWVSAVRQDSADAITTGGEFNGRLMAFDALNLTKLWESQDQVPFAKFIPPTIAGGKVFRAAYKNQIFVYGLTPTPGGSGGTSTSPTRPITAVWQTPDHLDLFMTSRDSSGGSVLSTNWEAVCQPPSQSTRGWRGWFPINSLMDTITDNDPLPPGFAFLASKAAPVAAVWRPSKSPDDLPHMDLFVTGKNGRVMSIVWEQPKALRTDTGLKGSLASGWQSWFEVRSHSDQIPPGVTPGQPITALWRPPKHPGDLRHLDLFITANDEVVWSTFYDEANPPWADWFVVRSPSGQVPPHVAPGQPVTAVWRPSKNPGDPRHLDLFITGKDGVVWSAFYDEANPRWADWFVVRSSSGQVPPHASPGQPVTAVWRPSKNPGDPRHLDLFITDKDGVVQSTFFDEEHPPWADWFVVRSHSGQIPPRAAPGQLITAVWRPSKNPRDPRHLDLFITDKDGAVQSTFFDETSPPWTDWFVLRSATGLAPPPAAPRQPVTAVWSNPSHLDLFMTEKDGRVVTTFFDNFQWRPEGWFPI
jgi:hypothetical protein